MEKCYILCRSVTHASKGQRYLRRKGITALIERPPREIFQKPCGYCIVVKCELAEQAVDLLEQIGVDVKTVAHFDLP